MKFDVPDCLLVLGVLLIVGGVALVHLPSAVIVFGILSIGIALLSTGRQRR
jgi:hypothetical protein